MATSYWLEDAERVQMLIAVRRLGAARPRDPTTRDAPIAALVTATGGGIMERRYGVALERTSPVPGRPVVAASPTAETGTPPALCAASALAPWHRPGGFVIG